MESSSMLSPIKLGLRASLKGPSRKHVLCFAYWLQSAVRHIRAYNVTAEYCHFQTAVFLEECRRRGDQAAGQKTLQFRSGAVKRRLLSWWISTRHYLALLVSCFRCSVLLHTSVVALHAMSFASFEALVRCSLCCAACFVKSVHAYGGLFKHPLMTSCNMLAVGMHPLCVSLLSFIIGLQISTCCQHCQTYHSQIVMIDLIQPKI